MAVVFMQASWLKELPITPCKSTVCRSAEWAIRPTPKAKSVVSAAPRLRRSSFTCHWAFRARRFRRLPTRLTGVARFEASRGRARPRNCRRPTESIGGSCFNYRRPQSPATAQAEGPRDCRPLRSDPPGCVVAVPLIGVVLDPGACKREQRAFFGHVPGKPF